MSFDASAALVLAEEAARAFEQGILGLVQEAQHELNAESARLADEGQALADLQAQLQASCARLDAERDELTELQVRLETEAGRLAEAQSELTRERANFEADKKSWGAGTVHFNVSGRTTVSVLRSTLLMCDTSVFAAALSGRWSTIKDDEGRIFINFPPDLFLPLIDYMQLRSVEDPDSPTPVPSFDDRNMELQFQQMLRFYGLLEWVYRPEPVAFSVTVGQHRYAVLPPQPAEEAVVGRDMQDQVLVVPPGWEVLSSDVGEFDEAIAELTARCWGAQVLCVENGRGGFDSYRTAIRTVGGPPGSVFEKDIEWLERVDGRYGFRFRGLSGRLVVRVRRGAFSGSMPDAWGSTWPVPPETGSVGHGSGISVAAGSARENAGALAAVG